MTKRANKVGRYYRLASHTITQIEQLAGQHGRSQSETIAIAIDRMAREKTKDMDTRTPGYHRFEIDEGGEVHVVWYENDVPIAYSDALYHADYEDETGKLIADPGDFDTDNSVEDPHELDNWKLYE